MSKIPTIKIVVVGDGGVGKTCLLLTYTCNAFPGEYGYGWFDSSQTFNVLYNEKPHELSLVDTAGQDDYDRLRPLCYPQTGTTCSNDASLTRIDVFIVAYSVSNRESFGRVKEKWVPEIRHHVPNVPFILCATKIDLYKDEQTKQKLQERGKTFVTPEEGKQLAIQLGAAAFAQVSSLEGIKVLDSKSNVFLEAMHTFYRVREKKPVVKKKKPFLRSLLSEVKEIHTLIPFHRLKDNDANVWYPLEKNPDGYCYQHTSCIYDNILYVIGGVSPTQESNKEEEKSSTNKNLRIFRFDLRMNGWIKPIESTYENTRFHCSVLYENAIYVLYGKARVYCNTLIKYQIDTQQWSAVNVNGKRPPPRFGASAVVYDKKMYVFGGYEADLSMSTNNIYCFSFADETWTKIEGTQNKPSARYLHTAVLYEKKMIVFGGLTDNGTSINDVHAYDFATNSWSQLKTKGKVMPPCFGHSSVITGAYMYVFGGSSKKKHTPTNDFSLLNLNTLEWSKVTTKGATVSARCYHSAECHGNCIYMVGGKDKGENMYSDIYVQELWSFYFNNIPDVLVLEIFSYLSPSDLLQLTMTSKLFWKWSLSDRLWKIVTRGVSSMKSVTSNYRQEYLRQNTNVLRLKV